MISQVRSEWDQECNLILISLFSRLKLPRLERVKSWISSPGLSYTDEPYHLSCLPFRWIPRCMCIWECTTTTLSPWMVISLWCSLEIPNQLDHRSSDSCVALHVSGFIALPFINAAASLLNLQPDRSKWLLSVMSNWTLESGKDTNIFIKIFGCTLFYSKCTYTILT